MNLIVCLLIQIKITITQKNTFKKIQNFIFNFLIASYHTMHVFVIYLLNLYIFIKKKMYLSSIYWIRWIDIFFYFLINVLYAFDVAYIALYWKNPPKLVGNFKSCWYFFFYSYTIYSDTLWHHLKPKCKKCQNILTRIYIYVIHI